MTSSLLAVSQGDIPVAYRVLALYVQLESLTTDDARRIGAANQLLLSWLGQRLTWALPSYAGHVQAFRPDLLDYASVYPEDLDVDEAPPEMAGLAYELAARAHDEFLVFCHGGSVSNHASPWGVRYLFEIGDPSPEAPRRLQTRGFLRVTIPVDSNIDDFGRWVDSIVELLRVRWAIAGLSYAGWEIRWKEEAVIGDNYFCR